MSVALGYSIGTEDMATVGRISAVLLRTSRAAKQADGKRKNAASHLVKVMRCVAPVIGDFVERRIQPLHERIAELEKARSRPVKQSEHRAHD